MHERFNRKTAVQRLWFYTVLFAVGLAISVIYGALRAENAQQDVPPCGENAGWIEIDPGTIACTMKNGQIVNVRRQQ